MRCPECTGKVVADKVRRNTDTPSYLRFYTCTLCGWGTSKIVIPKLKNTKPLKDQPALT